MSKVKPQQRRANPPGSFHNQTAGIAGRLVVQPRDIAGGLHLLQTVALPSPNQLPPRPQMVDREGAIAALKATRDDAANATTITLITGSPGVAKTVLARNLAPMIRRDYPTASCTRTKLATTSAAPGWHARTPSGWVDVPLKWLTSARTSSTNGLATDVVLGVTTLVCLDVLRPGLGWMLQRRPTHLARVMQRIRDPEGFERVDRLTRADRRIPERAAHQARTRIAVILACKSGTISDITVGDCVELLDAITASRGRTGRAKTLFYELLLRLNIFPPDAPTTIHAFTPVGGQLTVAELVDRYEVACTPVGDLLVDYLRERQPAVDYTTLETLARVLAGRFWADLEHHHPGIDPLHLPDEVASAWKKRIQTKTRAIINAAGELIKVTSPACRPGTSLRPDPGQKPRLIEIRDNLIARITEARAEGRLGEAEGLHVSLAGAEDKLAQLGQRATINLACPHSLKWLAEAERKSHGNAREPPQSRIR